jgi:hypothetical protein
LPNAKSLGNGADDGGAEGGGGVKPGLGAVGGGGVEAPGTARTVEHLGHLAFLPAAVSGTRNC